MSEKVLTRLGAVLMLAFTGILWLQRDYMTPFGGVFPDKVMIALMGLCVLSLVLSFIKPPVEEAKDDKDKIVMTPGKWIDLILVSIVLLAWVFLLEKLGFFICGIAGFSFLSIYLHKDQLNLKIASTCIISAFLMTGLLYQIFAKLLLVPLPLGTAFY